MEATPRSIPTGNKRKRLPTDRPIRNQIQKSDNNICITSARPTSLLTMANGIKLTKVPELIALLRSLLRSFRLEDQQKRFRAPAWDLNIVLQHLTSDAYEPLQRADFEPLTQKTLFILALATAVRMSEIHAIDFNPITFDSGNNSSALLGLRWDFIAKNQLPGQPDRQFHVPALSSVLGAEDTEDLSLCPVRALRLYLQKSKPRRQGFKRLFIPLLRNTHTEVSRTTISFWMRAVILRAYRAVGLDPPSASNPHEALASTLALHGNCSIMEGCLWISDTVFTNRYLRDLATEDNSRILPDDIRRSHSPNIT
ncbi:uncharacterized protein [Haliotis cracherodii]|uniref:uncharacterized protein n=1 Tax=Haliotis cracherodii TaxID=6455 RepID=UPI0039EA6B83